MKFYNKIAFWIVSVWSIVEAVLCILVLCTYNSKNSHTDNFLFEICEKDGCGQFIRKALIGRLITLTLLFLGNLMVIILFLTKGNK